MKEKRSSLVDKLGNESGERCAHGCSVGLWRSDNMDK